MDSRAHQEQVNLAARTGMVLHPDTGQVLRVADAPAARSNRKRAKGGTVDDADWRGPWADYELARAPGTHTVEELEAMRRDYDAKARQSACRWACGCNSRGHPPLQRARQEEEAALLLPAPQDPAAALAEAAAAEAAAQTEAARPPKPQSKKEAPGPTPCSRLLVDAAPDYLGRSWTHYAGQRGQTPLQCFAPRKRHASLPLPTKAGVTRLRFLPDTAHLVLGSAQDGCCRLWSWSSHKELAQYWGHNKAAKDCAFLEGGTRFASVGFDKRLVLWDVEVRAARREEEEEDMADGRGQTARAISTVPLKHMAYCVATSGDALLAGCHDNHIYQFDQRTGDSLVQDYDRHLGPVNSVTMIERGTRFVSTSDDKTIRYWETGIGVDIKVPQRRQRTRRLLTFSRRFTKSPTCTRCHAWRCIRTPQWVPSSPWTTRSCSTDAWRATTRYTVCCVVCRAPLTTPRS